ncbi:hypothetical protein [Sporomusa malonica]|uniref:Uncharacterized protein n=1 Tax=Sporomusa malonica TaxID=112901 RepID=A0A1W2DF55_9FIRM|nr:hypothetical protein [Sporomusa malonica]SMC96101.1 hypothetical protein SAMN04488500_11583 [Sporomusa malonica]
MMIHDTSYNIVIWHSKKMPNEQEAATIYERILQGNLEDLEPSNDIATFLSELQEKYPSFEQLQNDDMEKCPWEAPFTTSDCYAILPLKREWGQLVKMLVSRALKHNLIYYDPQNKIVYHPIAAFSWLKKLRQHVMP